MVEFLESNYFLDYGMYLYVWIESMPYFCLGLGIMTASFSLVIYGMLLEECSTSKNSMTDMMGWHGYMTLFVIAVSGVYAGVVWPLTVPAAYFLLRREYMLHERKKQDLMINRLKGIG